MHQWHSGLTPRLGGESSRCATTWLSPVERRPEPLSELEPRVWYVDLTRTNMAQVTPKLEILAGTRERGTCLRSLKRRLRSSLGRSGETPARRPRQIGDDQESQQHQRHERRCPVTGLPVRNERHRPREGGSRVGPLLQKAQSRQQQDDAGRGLGHAENQPEVLRETEGL